MNSYVKFGTRTSKVLLYIVSKNIRLHICHWWIRSENAKKREKCSFVCLFDDHQVVIVVMYFKGWWVLEGVGAGDEYILSTFRIHSEKNFKFFF